MGGPSLSDRGSVGGRVAVFGDVGGHVDELYSQLVKLGADPDSLILPADLTVVQLGDLVHRGPDSAGTVQLVHQIRTAQPGRWFQLAGNHEAQYLEPRPRFEWPETLDDESANLLRHWWFTGAMTPAVAVATPAGEWLVTHAGLTEGFWRCYLDSPISAAEAARRLNAMVGTATEPAVLRAGEMLNGVIDLAAGPLWAAAGTELLPSWQHVSMPFSQVHGHSTVLDWRSGRRYASPNALGDTDFDFDRRHSTTRFGDRQIVGIDPVLGARAGVKWAPLVLGSAVVVTDEGVT
ncbi:metallophosphoesterase [Jatrophihabitans sp. DSM 45814]